MPAYMDYRNAVTEVRRYAFLGDPYEPMKALSDVLSKLDQWQHFPAYRLKRRVDVFSKLFLPVVIANGTTAQAKAAREERRHFFEARPQSPTASAKTNE